MRGPRLFLFFSLKIGEDQKKRVFMFADVMFSLKVSVKARTKKVVVVRDKAPHFLRGPSLQPA